MLVNILELIYTFFAIISIYIPFNVYVRRYSYCLSHFSLSTNHKHDIAYEYFFFTWFRFCFLFACWECIRSVKWISDGFYVEIIKIYLHASSFTFHFVISFVSVLLFHDEENDLFVVVFCVSLATESSLSVIPKNKPNCIHN